MHPSLEDTLQNQFLKELEAEEKRVEEEFKFDSAGLDYPKTYEEVIDEIIENDNYYYFMDKLDEILSSIQGTYSSLEDFLEEIKEFKLYESKYYKIYLNVLELIKYISIEDYFLLKSLYDKIETDSEKRLFLSIIQKKINILIERVKMVGRKCLPKNIEFNFFEENGSYLYIEHINKNSMEIKTEGYFSLDRGTTDNIYFNLFINNKKIQQFEHRGEIEKNHGDYILVDDSYYNPEHSDECFVILDNFAELVKEYFEKGFEKIINLTFKLEDLLIELE